MPIVIQFWKDGYYVVTVKEKYDIGKEGLFEVRFVFQKLEDAWIYLIGLAKEEPLRKHSIRHEKCVWTLPQNPVCSRNKMFHKKIFCSLLLQYSKPVFLALIKRNLTLF